jgi:hypothetical protein
MLIVATLALGLVWAGSARAQAPCTPSGVQGPGADLIKPIGRWMRKIDKNHVRLDIEEGRLHLRCAGEKSLVIHADYQITRDRVVYGIVTSVEFDEEDTEGQVENLSDAPFSFSFRLDEGTLLIRDLKCAVDEFYGKKWTGRFKAVEPEKPIRQAPPGTLHPPPQVPPSAPLSGSAATGSMVCPGSGAPCIGAGLGALAGAAVAGRRNALAGAATGAGTGAVAGGLIGNGIDQDQKKVEVDAATAQAATNAQALSLQDIVQLSASGTSDAIIINQIRTSNAVYILTGPDIVYLKQNGVRDTVILEMQATAASPDSLPPTSCVPCIPQTPPPPPPQAKLAKPEQAPEVFNFIFGYTR